MRGVCRIRAARYELGWMGRHMAAQLSTPFLSLPFRSGALITSSAFD
jgi:hypothetical protein